jgi:hypothetical protein
VVLAPLLLGAADPGGDLVACASRRPTASEGPDIVFASGGIVELGQTLRFELRFTDPLVVPDEEGRPFRIDVLVRDPSARAYSFEYYRGVNRIVRLDAVAEPELEIVLIPERALNRFPARPPQGEQLVIELPGRLLTETDDVEGLDLTKLRWTVVVRDEAACDFLGNGRATRRLRADAGATSAPPASPSRSTDDLIGAALDGPLPWVAAALVGAAGGLAAGALSRRRRTERSEGPLEV